MIARRKPLKRSTKPIRPRKKAPVRVGKVTGKVRLWGDAIDMLRRECWERDRGVCQSCGISTYWEARFDGDPQAFDMAHGKSRGASGSDAIDNVETYCHECHMREHNGR